MPCFCWRVTLVVAVVNGCEYRFKVESSSVMLLDAASMYFRAFYGVPDSLKSPDGKPVNAIRGFADMIARLVTEYRPREIVAAWDNDWRPEFRVRAIPSYK